MGGRRSNLEITYKILSCVEGGEGGVTRLMHAVGLSFNLLKRYLSQLVDAGLLSMRPVTEMERRRDRRGRERVEITGEGRRLLRDLEALDRRAGGLLLEW